MQRSVLEKIAGSFDALEEWGRNGFMIVVFITTVDVAFGGSEKYMDAEYLLPLILAAVGACLIVMLLGLIGLGGVKLYCFWFDKTDPTEPAKADR